MLSNQDSLKRSLNVKKSKLERFFGSENILELKNDLIEGLKGDKFRENNKNILNNFFKDNPNSNNFLNDFCTWSEDKTKESLKTRFRIATINVILVLLKPKNERSLFLKLKNAMTKPATIHPRVPKTLIQGNCFPGSVI